MAAVVAEMAPTMAAAAVVVATRQDKTVTVAGAGLEATPLETSLTVGAPVAMPSIHTVVAEERVIMVLLETALMAAVVAPMSALSKAPVPMVAMAATAPPITAYSLAAVDMAALPQAQQAVAVLVNALLQLHRLRRRRFDAAASSHLAFGLRRVWGVRLLD
jgi:hypothetical protein